MADLTPSLSTFDEQEFNSRISPFIILGFCLKAKDEVALFEKGMNEMQSRFTPEELGPDVTIGLGLVKQATERADRKLVRCIIPGTEDGECITPAQVIRGVWKGVEILGEVFQAIQQKLDEADTAYEDDFRGMALMRKALRDAADDLGVFVTVGVVEPPLQGLCLDLAA